VKIAIEFDTIDKTDLGKPPLTAEQVTQEVLDLILAIKEKLVTLEPIIDVSCTRIEVSK
jgi:hypothetical protein